VDDPAFAKANFPQIPDSIQFSKNGITLHGLSQKPSMEFNITEIIGYAASLFVLLSFFNKNLRNLRLVNSVGCALFVAYGILLGSIPIIVTNVAILLVNAYYLLIKKEPIRPELPMDDKDGI